MALVAPQAMKAKGPSDPRAVNGQAPGCARRQGTGCPKNLQADRAKARPPGFGSYPARPLILDLATPDFTTRKGAQFSLRSWTMKAQCPICQRWNEIPEQLTIPANWQHTRRNGSTTYYIRAAEGRSIAEVWRNVEYSGTGRTPTDWHWQYMPLDQCCGFLPGGNKPSKDAAMKAAIAAFSDHCAANDCAIVRGECDGK